MIATLRELPTKKDVHYPSSDGEPMAETGIHVQAIMHLHQALQDFFAARPDVFIASDMFWYWIAGDTDTKNAPDVMVVPGIGNDDRRSFRSFDEGAIPAVVFEMASENTWRKDENEKYALYESLGVREYFLFDPEALYLSSPLKGYRLNNTAYRRLFPVSDMLESELGFKLKAEGHMLRLYDTVTGLPIPTRAERARDAERKATDAERKATDAERKAAEEHQRADTLQAQVAKLQALLQKHNIPSGNGS